MDWKRSLQDLFKRVGLEVHLVAKGGSYTPCPPYGYSTYSPWFEAEFQDRYARIRGRTLLTEDRCYLIDRFARHGARLEGEFAECGVYKGGSAWLLAEAMLASGKPRPLHLFDTFTGMPDPEQQSHHGKGDFGDVSLQDVRRFLSGYPFVEFHPGLIPETLAGLEDRRFALVYVDVDIYRSVSDCCRFFYPRMNPGAVMLFDDYGLPAYREEAKRAIDEFFEAVPETPIVLGTGQCLVLKGPEGQG